MKILMVADYTYRIHSGNSTLHKGRMYETEGWQGGYFLVDVEDRHEVVRVPERLARMVFESEPKVTGTDGEDPSLKEFVSAAMQDHQGKWTVARPESDHYHTGSVDVWQFADENFSSDEVLGFHRINAIKYLARYGKKNGYNRKDLEKARVEIDKLLELHDKHRS